MYLCAEPNRMECHDSIIMEWVESISMFGRCNKRNRLVPFLRFAGEVDREPIKQVLINTCH